jgi:arylsulfatase A-like enzyme/Flp pilus assembly protein TadD
MKPRARKRARLMKKSPPAQTPAQKPPPGQSTPQRPVWVRLTVLVAAGLILATAAAGLFLYHRAPAARQVAGSGLNMLLITVDTTRADYLGCYGRPNGRTPNIDRLAREGALFERCIASAPLTSTSHASILTGNYPYVHGVRSNSAGSLAAGNLSLAEVLKDSGYHTAATVASFVLNRDFGFAQGFDEYHDVNKISVDDPQQAERKGDEISRDAIALLRTLAPAPFFLWVHFYDPHYPYETKRPAPYTPAQAYEDEIAFMDEQIGQVLAELQILGLEQRTLVVLVGDHGEGLGQHGESQHAYFIYHTTLHVPLIMRCPGTITPGASIADVVRTIDIPPTILALLGLPPLDQAQGTSLVGRLRGASPLAPLEAYSEGLEAHAQFGVSRLRSLTDDDWKYILAPKPELYHLADDPGETSSVLPEHPDIAARMRERLRTLIAESPPPVSDDRRVPALSDADRARLESLGYAGSAVRHDEAGQTELQRFEPEGGNPLDFAAQFELTVQARDALQNRDYAAGVQMLQQVLQVLPDAPRPAGLIGTALLSQGRAPEAIPIFERALALIPEDTYLRSTYGSALMQAGRYQEAADQLRIALRENPQNARILHNLAIALIQLGRLDEADQNLQLALQIEPANPRLFHTLGMLRVRQNRLAEAEQCLGKALQIDPDFRQCQEDLRRLRQDMPSFRP